jgi:hypothetical protein
MVFASSHYNTKPRETAPFEVTQADIDVTPSDKNRLIRFCREEMKYYNRLVEGLSPLLRTSTDFLAHMTDSWLRFYSHLAETNTTLRPYLTKKPTLEGLSDQLQPHYDMLVKLTEKQVILSEIAVAPYVLLPVVKRNLVYEFLKTLSIRSSNHARHYIKIG